MTRLLESERTVLMGGNLEALSEIAKQKEAMLPNVRTLDADAQARLRASADQTLS